jgi:hypothetical protein
VSTIARATAVRENLCGSMPIVITESRTGMADQIGDLLDADAEQRHQRDEAVPQFPGRLLLRHQAGRLEDDP